MYLISSSRARERARRLGRHLREGTIWNRVLWEFDKWEGGWKNSRKKYVGRFRRWQWNRFVGVNGHVDIKVEGNATLRLYSDSVLGFEIFCHGFEEKERIFLSRYLNCGDVFVDVGANIGLFTVIAAKCVGKEGAVYAFEPVEEPRRRLVENIQINKYNNVHVEKLALSDRCGDRQIFVPGNGRDAWSSLGHPIVEIDVHTSRVETIAWDLYAEQHGIRNVNMIKIDVEGWENRVLDGAKTILASSEAPLLQVEFTDAAAKASDSSCAYLYQHLVKLGYTVCRYDMKNNKLVPDKSRLYYSYVNLYATKYLDKDNRRLMSR